MSSFGIVFLNCIIAFVIVVVCILWAINSHAYKKQPFRRSEFRFTFWAASLILAFAISAVFLSLNKQNDFFIKKRAIETQAEKILVINGEILPLKLNSVVIYSDENGVEMVGSE